MDKVLPESSEYVGGHLIVVVRHPKRTLWQNLKSLTFIEPSSAFKVKSFSKLLKYRCWGLYQKLHFWHVVTFDPSNGRSLQVNQSETYSCQLSSCNCVSGEQDIFVIWTKSVVSPSPSSTTIVLVQLLLLILVGHKVEIQL